VGHKSAVYGAFGHVAGVQSLKYRIAVTTETITPEMLQSICCLIVGPVLRI
jgi:hypothetical protein